MRATCDGPSIRRFFIIGGRTAISQTGASARTDKVQFDNIVFIQFKMTIEMTQHWSTVGDHNYRKAVDSILFDGAVSRGAQTVRKKMTGWEAVKKLVVAFEKMLFLDSDGTAKDATNNAIS